MKKNNCSAIQIHRMAIAYNHIKTTPYISDYRQQKILTQLSARPGSFDKNMRAMAILDVLLLISNTHIQLVNHHFLNKDHSPASVSNTRDAALLPHIRAALGRGRQSMPMIKIPNQLTSVLQAPSAADGRTPVVKHVRDSLRKTINSPGAHATDSSIQRANAPPVHGNKGPIIKRSLSARPHLLPSSGILPFF